MQAKTKQRDPFVIVLTIFCSSLFYSSLFYSSQSVAQNHGEMPFRGMSMDSVANTYGNPEEKRSAVGNPPITRWIYPGYTIYFEYQTVIHTVTGK